MKKAILATKVGMTQIFNEDGVLTPVTVLQAGPCVVTQVKTEDNDGYKAVQVGFVDKREKLINKPMKGHFDKAGVSYKRYVRDRGDAERPPERRDAGRSRRAEDRQMLLHLRFEQQRDACFLRQHGRDAQRQGDGRRPNAVHPCIVPSMPKPYVTDNGFTLEKIAVPEYPFFSA